MSAYCFWDNIEVSDPAKLEEYKERVLPIVEKFGGRYLILGGRSDVVEGNWPLSFPIVIEFPNMDVAHRWYQSEDYADLKALRQSASKANAIFIEGIQNTE